MRREALAPAAWSAPGEQPMTAAPAHLLHGSPAPAPGAPTFVPSGVRRERTKVTRLLSLQEACGPRDFPGPVAAPADRMPDFCPLRGDFTRGHNAPLTVACSPAPMLTCSHRPARVASVAVCGYRGDECHKRFGDGGEPCPGQPPVATAIQVAADRNPGYPLPATAHRPLLTAHYVHPFTHPPIRAPSRGTRGSRG